jgi:hypothetical protein
MHEAHFTRVHSFIVKAKRAAASVLCGAAMALAAVSAIAGPELGVYRFDAPSGPSNVDAFGLWLGRPASVAAAFEAGDTWANIDGASWQLGPWSQWVRGQAGRNVSLAVPMMPSSGGSLSSCAAGQYDVYWANLANELAYYGLHWAYLRLGWEMDGAWFPWNATPGSGKEASYAGCFRRIVQVMRQTQPANQWKFVLNPTTTGWSRSYLDAIWPGDQYVDIVGLDIYDQSWVANTYPYPSTCDAACRLTRQQNAWNLQHAPHLYAVRDFAVAHGKLIAFPEWGVAIRTDGPNGGGDDPYFIQQMYNFMQDPNNYVGYHIYWDVSMSDIDARLTDSVPGDYVTGPTRFPNSAALFKQLFQPTASTPSNTAPTVSFTAPSAGQTVSGTISYAANASDDAGVARVDFALDSNALFSDTSSPYAGSLDTTKLANGTHVLKATAFDAAGLSASSQVSINVQNIVASPTSTTTLDRTPPTVSLTSPAQGSLIYRRASMTLEAAASDNVGVVAVEFLVNGTSVCLVTAAPYRCSWNTGARFQRSYTISAKATDAAGNAGVSSLTYQSAK